MGESMLVVSKNGDLRMSAAEKTARYEEVAQSIASLLSDEEDLLASMASIVCVLHHAFPYYFWTGFYRRVGEAELLIGPYQGTLGCLRIAFSRGVCGAAARSCSTVVVPDVNAFPGHIACDSQSASEIVVPVVGPDGSLIAVFDVDSTLLGAFDEIDRFHLERIMRMLASKSSRPVVVG